MPVVSCPKCPAKLKVPDGVSGNTKCPKCGAVFPVSAPPAFEVVDGPAPAAPQPAVKPKADDEDFEVVDKKPKKRTAAEDEDDPDVEFVVYDENGKVLEVVRSRKRNRGRNDDEDEADRPRSKRRRSDDDDDEGDRPRKKKGKKKRRRYDDEEESWQPGPRGGGGFGSGKTGALLMSISFWLNLGAYGLIALYALIAWIMVLAASASSPSSRGPRGIDGGGDGSFGELLVVLPGLVGLGAWIVGTVGCAFAIAGPAKSRGMAITATVFAGVHLVLLGITFSNLHSSSGGGFGMTRGLGVGSPAWLVVASTLPALDALLPMLFYSSRAVSQGEYVIALLAAICELLRLVFMLLTLKGMAEAARDGYAVEKSQFGLTMVGMVAGGVAAFVLLMVVILAEGKFKSLQTYAHLTVITALFTYLGYAFMMLNPALAALQTKDACDRR